MATATQTRLTAEDVDVNDIVRILQRRPAVHDGDAVPPNWQTLIEAGCCSTSPTSRSSPTTTSAAIADAGSWDGRVYSVNLGRVSYSGMFVNLDLLAEVGVDVPTTWNELVAACAAVKEAGNECMTVGGADGLADLRRLVRSARRACTPTRPALVEGSVDR